MRFLLFLLFPAALHAQIYADFTVSSGGSPLGTFRVLLEHEKAPRTCANFIGLASGKRPWIDVTNGAVRTNTPYYDGLTFHRLIHSFVIQGGSPNGQGNDGPGYTILDEYEPTLRHSSDYVLSMAKSAFPNTGGSQFFITLRATPELNDKYSVFGRVISGTAIIDGFKNPALFPTGVGDKPVTPIIMDSVFISGPSYAGFDLNAASHQLPEIDTTVFTPVRNAGTGDFKIVFPRRARTDYLFYQSVDLTSWDGAGTLLSYDAAPSLDYSFGVVAAPRFFVNGATVRYDLIPDSHPDLSSAQKTIRILEPDGSRMEMKLSSPQGTWKRLNPGGTTDASGLLVDFLWTDVSATAGFVNPATSQSFRVPLGELQVIFDAPVAPGNSTYLGTWLSFHTPNAGWLEETQGNTEYRRPFEILSN